MLVLNKRYLNFEFVQSAELKIRCCVVPLEAECGLEIDR